MTIPAVCCVVDTRMAHYQDYHRVNCVETIDHWMVMGEESVTWHDLILGFALVTVAAAKAVVAAAVVAMALGEVVAEGVVQTVFDVLWAVTWVRCHCCCWHCQRSHHH